MDLASFKGKGKVSIELTGRPLISDPCSRSRARSAARKSN